MEFFIFFLLPLIVIVFVVKKNKKKKAYEAFMNTSGHEVSLQIKEELIKNGFKVSNLFEFYDTGVYTGSFTVYSGSEKIGTIEFCANPTIFSSGGWQRSMRAKNSGAYNGYFHVIENVNIGLFISSELESQEVPPFMKISAEVISRSGYKFKHPDWLFEDPKAKNYLNVLFQ